MRPVKSPSQQTSNLQMTWPLKKRKRSCP